MIQPQYCPGFKLIFLLKQGLIELVGCNFFLDFVSLLVVSRVQIKGQKKGKKWDKTSVLLAN